MEIEIKNCGAYSMLGYLGKDIPALNNVKELTIIAHFVKGVDVFEEVKSLQTHFPHIDFKIIVV